MNSMTGYSQNIITIGTTNYFIAIKSVNSRFLDLSIQIPGFLTSYEQNIREAVATQCTRGKIDVIIQQKSGRISSHVLKNDEYLKRVYDDFQKFTKKLKIHKKTTVSDFFNFLDFYEKTEETDPKALWDIIEPALQTCITDMLQERQKEGTATQKDIEIKLQILEQAISTIEKYSYEIEKTIQENLKKKFNEVMGNALDETRILSETAVYLAKYTISEEIMRFKTHLINFRNTMQETPCGKKLDFISQELNREANTIASKVLIPEISSEVIAIKQAIEDIREQIRNIE